MICVTTVGVLLVWVLIFSFGSHLFQRQKGGCRKDQWPVVGDANGVLEAHSHFSFQCSCDFSLLRLNACHVWK